jgi:hypothetical protein
MEPAPDKPFTLLVSIVGRKARGYTFVTPRVLVGRARNADLRIEHAAVARAQFLVERGVGSAGEPRFRITPYEATNPTYVNERPAVEGTLTPGDVVAVGPVRVVLERKLHKPAAARPKDNVSPLRMILLAATVAMALFVAWLLFGGGSDGGAGDLANTPTRLFGDMLEVRCANPIECDTRAHESYGRGKKFLAQAGADPGNLYRAVIELDKAAQFRRQSGRPLGDMADVDALAVQARSRAEAEFADAKFRMQRAIAAGDLKRCAEEAALLAHLVPDANHPYRVKLDAYRRTLPAPKRDEATP